MKYLVINNSKNGLYTYAQQYQLFDKRNDAVLHFKAIGGEDWPFELSKTPGIASISKSGLIDVTFMPIISQK